MSKRKKNSDLVFDDDTDDSDDDLEVFRNNVKSLPSKEDLNSAGSHESEDESDEESDAEDENDEEDDTDSDNEDAYVQRSSNNAAINARLGKLSSLLSNQNQDESSDDESDDQDGDGHEGLEEQDSEPSDNEDDDSSEDEAKDAEEESSDNENEEKEESDSEVNKNKGKYVKMKSGKRKLEDREEIEDIEQNAPSVEEEREKYRNKLSRLSVEEILKIKESLGNKVFNARWSGGKTKKEKTKVEFKRENKNRPREMSSKVRVPKMMKVVPVTKEAKRDPRFDPLCGEFDKKDFRRRYGFLNKVKQKELTSLKKQLKHAEGEEKEKIAYLVQRTENQLRAERDRANKEYKESLEKKDIREKLERGEKPVFKSKKEKREQDLVDTYERLKKSGKVDKYIKKKSKQHTTRDRIMLEKNSRQRD